MLSDFAAPEDDLPSRSARPTSSFSRARSFELGLLVLRSAAALVLVTWGWGKFLGLTHALLLHRPLDSGHFTQLVRNLGFPFPAFMAVCAALNESLVAALLLFGILTRPAALFASLGMIGALYSSVRLDNELLRAALCALIFAALALLGAGRYSVGYALRPRSARPPEWTNDAGLLLLRIGGAIALIALAATPMAKGKPDLFGLASTANWPLVVACGGAVSVGFGFLSRPISAGLSLFWICAMSSGLLDGHVWNVYPIRDALFAIIYGALAFIGPGRGTAASVRLKSNPV